MTDGRSDPTPVLTLKLENRPAEVTRLADGVELFGEQQGLGLRMVHALQLALEEVVTNVISYAWSDGGLHELTVDLGVEGSDVVARVEDDGKPFDPLAALPPDLDAPLEDREEGGLGIFLTRHYMDDVRYLREGERNVLILRKTRDD